ncbi:DUF4157 domain-containing protein [Paenibacillus sp. CGMCC 1.16610]|uniref:DUF4157 domain-containing protein n=1 Tax=Paenibacillus anseongense TaxID=2682845 RepID=A0ABW9U276_9BACL|nr:MULTISPECIES: DUF4157 domain-containing protein [Paenibacillus]MBA2943021.1 DUF4157 domain-containing protein [Paenibacillus sp. CGMCC 1.16610]MVQ33517.1 DUF4157 domain-containing protein [Paenibacillus anseongense]
MPMHLSRINRQPDTSLHNHRNKSHSQGQSAGADLMNIQRAIGNKAVGSMLSIQTKLTVGPAGDAYEQEADQVGKEVADKIAASENSGASADVQRSESGESEEEELQMKPSSETIQRSEGGEMEEEELQMKPSSETIQRSEGGEMEEEELQMKPSSETIQRSEGGEMEEEELQMKPSSETIQRSEGGEMEEEELQMKSSDGEAFEADASIESEIKSMQGSGSKMDAQIQAKMESAFNADFSNVNIHNNPQSSKMNASLGAEAFATGNDIFFREGRYNPDSREGQELLGHELTHVIQQRGGK